MPHTSLPPNIATPAADHTPMTLRIVGPTGETTEAVVPVPITMLTDRSAATLAVAGFRLALGNAVNQLLDTWVAKYNELRKG